MPPKIKISGFKRKGRHGQRYRKQINGRRYEIFFTGNKEQREAAYKAWVQKLMERHARNAVDNSITFCDFRDKFIRYIRTLQDKNTGKLIYSPRTVEEYHYCLADFERVCSLHYAGDVDYATLAHYRRVSRAAADRAQQNYYGVNKKMGSVIRALKWGMAEGLINVFSTAPLEVKLDTGEVIVKTLTADAVSLLIKYSSPKWKVAIKIGYYAGVRPEEMVHLLLSKIDFHTGITKIWEHEADKRQGITAWTPKRDKRRLVLLPPDVLQDIIQLNPKVYVLNNKHGRPFDLDNFDKAFKKNLRHVNREILRHEPNTARIDCTYKTLRKSNITALMNMGLAEEDASLSLGHANKKTSEKHYIQAETLLRHQEQKQLAQLEKIKKFILNLPHTIQPRQK